MHHTDPLSDLEKSHKKCGWNTHFYTETAVGHNYGSIDVYAEIHEDGKKELGATIVGEKKNYEIYKVQGTRLLYLQHCPKIK